MRKKRKVREGVVIGTKMQKTITVLLERLVKHPKYKKYIKIRKKIKARDENSECRIGDFVQVMETRPLSKTVNWRLVKIIKKAPELE